MTKKQGTITNLKLLIGQLLDLIFPPRCEVCKNGAKEALCRPCLDRVKFMKPHLGIYSAAIYEGVLREAIHRFKFNKRKRLAEPLGILLVNYLGQLPGIRIKELDAIVPVPLHKQRLRQRGFNQAEMLGRVISRYFGLPVKTALERSRDTTAQFDLPRPERFQNISGAFKVNDSQAVYNRRLLLLDDIYTTGATITECVKTLNTAGARRVEVLTLSRAVES